METVGSFEAKTHLPQLLERVAKGEEFTYVVTGSDEMFSIGFGLFSRVS
jgi:antitoxin (DNA-binding transcriptional repressor) of toxin-antitoxin stability system